MKFCWYFRLHIKIICRKFRIVRPRTFCDICTRDIWNVCLQTCRNNRMFWKVAYFLRKIQNLWVNNWRILRIENAKFSGYCFNMNSNIHCNFQMCISVPLEKYTGCPITQKTIYLSFLKNISSESTRNLLESVSSGQLLIL